MWPCRHACRCVHFYPRPPRGGRPRSGWSSCRSSRISIHALREEGDKALADELATRGISIHALREEGDCPQTASQPQPFDFYPRPPRGGRPRTATKRASSGRFLSTPSARRATKDGNKEGFEWQISIHALREEGDVCDGLDNRAAEISIHALREEGDLGKADLNVGEGEFLSTPSARRATVDIKTHADRDDISIHALREEGDHGGGDTMTQWSISIHALREEGDVKRSHLPGAGDNFYPRPPRGGRPILRSAVLAAKGISIHALREEGDPRRLRRAPR